MLNTVLAKTKTWVAQLGVLVATIKNPYSVECKFQKQNCRREKNAVLAKTSRDRKNCPPDGAICISCKIVHQMAPLALVPNLATRWSHMNWLQIWPPDDTTCICCKFDHQMAPLALVTNLPTRWLHLHCFQS